MTSTTFLIEGMTDHRQDTDRCDYIVLCHCLKILSDMSVSSVCVCQSQNNSSLIIVSNAVVIVIVIWSLRSRSLRLAMVLYSGRNKHSSCIVILDHGQIRPIWLEFWSCRCFNNIKNRYITAHIVVVADLYLKPLFVNANRPISKSKYNVVTILKVEKNCRYM